MLPCCAGDTVVQNGAGSGVGRAVIQLAAARGVRTVNIVRDRRAAGRMMQHRSMCARALMPPLTRAASRRPDFEAAAAELRALGATLVLRPEEARRSPEAAAALRSLPPARLGAFG
jgi:NADPH:quinone reductase-like Zn-dependent oxidoreductase